jgi:ACDE family multidrug resistance protein
VRKASDIFVADLEAKDSSDDIQSGSEKPPLSKPALWALFAVTVSGVMGATLVSPSLPAIAFSYGIAPTTAGLVLSVYTLPGILIAPLVGLAADRFGRKRVMLPCLLVHGIAGGACAFAPSFPLLLGLRLLQGMGSAGLVNLVVVTLGDAFRGVQRARMIGLNAAVLTVGTTLFPTAGGLLASRHWRLVFVPFWAVLAVAGVVAAVVPARSGPPGGLEFGGSADLSAENVSSVRAEGGSQGGEHAGYDSAARFGLVAVRTVLRTPATRRIMLRGFVLFVLIYGGILTSVPVLLARRLGAGPAAIGLFLTAGSIASMAMSSLAGKLREKLDPSSILLVAFVAYSFGMGGLAHVASSQSASQAFASIALCGVGEGLAIVLLQTRATEVAPEGLRGTSVAMFVSSARLGQTAGPVIAKATLDRFGFALAFVGYAAVAALMALEQVRRVLLLRRKQAGSGLARAERVDRENPSATRE